MADNNENKTTIHDWTGLSQPLTKLIDVVTQGVGKHTASYYRRKEADDRAYELKRLATELVEIQKILPNAEFKDGQLILPSKSENDLSLQQRFENRFEFQQARKQLNIENVTSTAVEELLSDPKLRENTSKEPVDPDWITRFFQTVEDINDEQMQQLWGKVLAGEVKTPNSFSLRTLEFLRNLKKDEAEIFQKVGKFASLSYEKKFVADINNSKYTSQQKSDIKFLEILNLKEIGLIYQEPLQLQFDKEKSLEIPSLFIYADQVVRFYHQNQISLNVLVFTKVGEELLNLLPIEFDINYLEFLCKPYYSDCNKIIYSKLLSHEEDQIRFDNKNEVTLYSKFP